MPTLDSLEARVVCWAISLLAVTTALTHPLWTIAIAAIVLLVIVGLATERDP